MPTTIFYGSNFIIENIVFNRCKHVLQSSFNDSRFVFYDEATQSLTRDCQMIMLPSLFPLFFPSRYCQGQHSVNFRLCERNCIPQGLTPNFITAWYDSA